MNVKNGSTPLEKLRDIIKAQNGILLTADLAQCGIPRTYLGMLVRKGEIQRISRGVYATAGDLDDEMFSFQARYHGAIFSHETALYLLGLSDRSPLFYSVTVPSGYNATLIKASGAKVYFVKRELCALGLIHVKSPHGHAIKTFDLERTLCDILRSRNQMDIQYINPALKQYVLHQDRNIDRLFDYAKQFGVQKIVRETIEVLL